MGIWTTAERRSITVQHTNGTKTFSGSTSRSRAWEPARERSRRPRRPEGPVQRLAAEGRRAVPSKVQTFGDDPNDLPALINAIYGLPIPTAARSRRSTARATWSRCS